MKNKKVGILTLYDIDYPGAQLQMYATNQILKELKFDPYLLSFERNFDFIIKRKPKVHSKNPLKSFFSSAKRFFFEKGIGSTIFDLKTHIHNIKFRKTVFNTVPYATSNMDYTVIGSNEVLSLEYGLNMMMFGHCLDTKKAIYYAPSCGKSSIQDYRYFKCDKLFESGLTMIDCLSARDENTYHVLDSFSSGRDIELVLDPILLYDFSKENLVNKIRTRYMVICTYGKSLNNSDDVAAIRRYAKLKNLKILSVGSYHNWCDKNVACNCRDWLSYFKNAECVITDNFYGTIACIVNNVQCVVNIDESLNKNTLKFLLKQFGLQNREIKDITYTNLVYLFNSEINYSRVNDKLNSLRESSYEYLKKALDYKYVKTTLI